jgi:hypothetical protein
MCQKRVLEAKRILQANDRGRYTVPTSSGLYPAQWNWDSCLVALGFAQYDQERAWREIETLFEAQWPDGMVPHIIFHEDDSSYFPNSSVWAAGPSKCTSGITQPPVAATALRYLYQKSCENRHVERLRKLLPRVVRWHMWLYSARGKQNFGLVSILHPWESGMDNSPVWDGPLRQVPEAASVSSLRRDTKYAATSVRPRTEDYNRYLHLLYLYRDHGYSFDKLLSIAPFRVADVAFNCILLRAERDLAYLLREIGDEYGAEIAELRAANLTLDLEAMWDEEEGFYYSVDINQNSPIKKPGIGSFLPLFANSDAARKHPRLADHMQRWLRKVRYGLCSYDPERAEYQPQCYWRGPVWVIVNWMLMEGLKRNGLIELADRLRTDSIELVETQGFHEYFDPESGAGLGGTGFSWTAAIYLVLMNTSSTLLG